MADKRFPREPTPEFVASTSEQIRRIMSTEEEELASEGHALLSDPDEPLCLACGCCVPDFCTACMTGVRNELQGILIDNIHDIRRALHGTSSALPWTPKEAHEMTVAEVRNLRAEVERLRRDLALMDRASVDRLENDLRIANEATLVLTRRAAEAERHAEEMRQQGFAWKTELDRLLSAIASIGDEPDAMSGR